MHQVLQRRAGGSEGSTASGTGGGIILQGDDSTGGPGANIDLRAGGSTSSDEGDGGRLQLTSGYSTYGKSGSVEIATGEGRAGASSGDVKISSGASCSGASGSITLETGAPENGEGGDIKLQVGRSSAGDGGLLSLSAGSTDANAAGGTVNITAGSAGFSGSGGNILLTAGSGENGNGGDVVIDAGASQTGGVGKIEIGATAQQINLGRSDKTTAVNVDGTVHAHKVAIGEGGAVINRHLSFVTGTVDVPNILPSQVYRIYINTPSAHLGDVVHVSFNKNLHGLILTSQIQETSGGDVRAEITLFNPGDGTHDVESGVFRISIWQY